MILLIVILLLSVSSIVYIEPAPYDIILIIIAIWYILFKRNKKSAKIFLPSILLWLFVVGNLLSMFFASQFAWSVRYFIITLYLIIGWLFYAMFINEYKEKGIKTILNGYTIASVISSIIGIMSYFNLVPFYRGIREGRMLSTFKDANVLAPFLVVGTMYSLYRATSTKGRKKYIWFIIILLTLISIFLAFSRAAYINLACSLLTYFILTIIFSKQNVKINSIIMLIILMVVSGLIIYNISKSPNISTIFISRIRKPVSEEIRFQRQAYVLQNFFTFPLGNGPGSSHFLRPAPHNVFMQVLYENGIFSFLIFSVFFVITLAKSIIQAVKHKLLTHNLYIVIASALVGLLVNSYFIDSLHWRHMWVLLAIPWGIN